MAILHQSSPLRALIISLLVVTTFAGTCQPILDHKSLQLEVFDTANPAVVIFHGPEKPAFDNLVFKLESFGICVSYFSCEDKANMKVCQAARLPTVPTAVLYADTPKPNPYTKKNFREPILMSESLQERSLEKFINKALPNNVQVLKSLSGFSPSQPSVLLFTQKTAVSLSYRILSYFYRESLGFFHVRIPEDEEEMDLSEYGVTSFPSLGVRLTDGKFIAFTGDIKNNNELLEFLSEFGASVAATSQSKDDSAVPSSSDNSAAVTPLTNAEFNALFATSEEAAYVVAVVRESSPVPQWWTALSGKCVGAVKSALFRCDPAGELTDAAQQLCSMLKDSNSLLMVLPYSQSSKKKALTNPSKYVTASDSVSDKVDIDAAIKRAQDSIPENVLPVLTGSELDSLLAAAQDTQTIAVLALSGKVVPNGVLRNVALSVKGKVQFGFIGQPSQMLLERIGNPPVPSVMALVPPPNNGEQFQIMIYDSAMFGPLTYNSITAFISTASRITAGSTENGDSSSSSSTSDHPKEPAVVKHVKTTEQWEALCGSQFKGLCAIAFMGAPEGADPDDAASVAKFQAAVDQLSSSSLYNFVWVDASCQVSLAEQLEVTGGATPALVVYSPLKNRFAKYVGKFAQSSLVAYLEGMAGGRVATFPLSTAPVFEDKDCTLPLDTATEDFEADDFLAEIQREEAEQAAAIKRALEEEKKQREAEKKESEDKKKKKKKTTKKKKGTKSEL